MGAEIWWSPDGPQRVVAVGPCGPRTVSATQSCFASVASRLESERPSRVVLHCASAWQALATIGACWSREVPVVLAPNAEAGTLADLTRDTDLLLVAHEAKSPDPSRLSSGPTAPWTAPLDSELLLICTSGSSGARKLVAKTPRQLFDECHTLESAFGHRMGKARVLGSVSHQHIYGLLFRVFWPLLSQRVFVEEVVLDPQRTLDELDMPEGAILVHSPAYLDRAPELLDLRRLRGRCRAIFSSGGPLGTRTAERVREQAGSAVIEVYGSTETGGVAWRQRDGSAASEDWKTFDGVRVFEHDGLLSVQSPHTAQALVGTADRFHLLSQDHFRLLGRDDRIVKIFEERVSLPEIEERLQRSEWVRRAAATTLERAGTARVAVAIELGESGLTALYQIGRSAMAERLRGELAEYFRATALPRQWRFVEQLPVDSQGKLAEEHVRRLFDVGGSQTLPAGRSLEQVSPGERRIHFDVGADHWFLRGHFPGYPVVPGVVQLHWIVRWAEDWLGRPVDAHTIQNLKFKDVLTPGASCTAVLQLEGDRLAFRIHSTSTEYSSGRIILRPEGNSPAGHGS
jgi:3-hydroxymyristoyl/3-hydroxydecanoyl-(acyl carrier protein) dehydratase/acyl-CoA synthetase (AMP-forming)/AMP-acid ligase II